MKKYTEDEVLKSLFKKHDVKVFPERGTVEILNGKTKKGQFFKKNDLGGGSWGKIDFLVNYCDYHLVKVAEFGWINIEDK